MERSLFVYDFPKADMEGICSYLENSDFRQCFVSCDVDFVWSLSLLFSRPWISVFLE